MTVESWVIGGNWTVLVDRDVAIIVLWACQHISYAPLLATKIRNMTNQFSWRYHVHRKRDKRCCGKLCSSRELNDCG